MRISLAEFLGTFLMSAVVGLFADDLLAALATFVLLAGLKLVATADRLYVLQAAYAFHWLQTTLGVFYLDFTGREVPAIYSSNYRVMVLIGLGCCMAIAIGIRVGMMLLKAPDANEERPGFAFSFGLLFVAYVITTSFEGTLTAMAADYPSLRQIIVTADTARLGVVFLILRRLLNPVPRWSLVVGLVGFEVLLGITGFFAGFREPIVLAALATLEIFDRRNVRHWLAMGTAGAFTVVLGLVWMGIRTEYRRDYVDLDNFEVSRSTRIRNVESLGANWLHADADTVWYTADKLVDRMWTIYYPALAVERVPSHLPHTNGEIISSALVHIVTPRVFFPGKPNLQSDSEKVRKYSGVMVAGAEQNTSIAFGYAAEAYIDFGLPWMFLPVLAFGVAIGLLYALFRKLIWHRDLLVSFSTVAFWLSLYLFERSWSTMLGVSLGMMIYLGVPIVLFDRFLLIRFFAQKHAAGGVMYDTTTQPSQAH
jgi:hypothetical protein